MKIFWPGNSPDLNIIERTWFYIKKETIKRGLISNRKKLRVRWEKYWEDILQKKIQEWIEVIPHHVAEVIRLKGGNEYKEGRKKG
jgi:trehalose-6-phosphate synthase